MRILISNDDGYKARGIHVLARLMAELGEVTVVAPKYHQSAMSMSVSLGMKRLAYKALPEEGPGDWHYLDATPASCVKFGLEYFYEHRNPDLVICGINHGSNAATAANYSATLGSAEEGALNGCKAIGVSVCDFSPDASFDLVEKYLPGIIRSLLDNWPEGRYGLLYSINFPKGDLLCPPGPRPLGEGVPALGRRTSPQVRSRRLPFRRHAPSAGRRRERLHDDRGLHRRRAGSDGRGPCAQ